MLIASILFYQKLIKYMEAIGLEVNTYDPYVSKNMIRNKKTTITWHVDDLKVSHVDKNGV